MFKQNTDYDKKESKAMDTVTEYDADPVYFNADSSKFRQILQKFSYSFENLF